MSDRYDTRPLLRLIECYALAIVGELPPSAETAAAVAVRRVYGEGEWKEVLLRTLKLPQSIDDDIRDNYRGYQAAARAQGVPNSAVEFSQMFADALWRRDMGETPPHA